MTRQIIISFEDPWYVARDIDTGVASQGKTLEEAQDNLREALELYFEGNEAAKTSTFYYLGSLEVG